MKAATILASIAAMFGVGAPTSLNPLGFTPFGPAPINSSGGHIFRSRTKGPKRPAGSKLTRKAEKHRLGLATLR